MLLTIFSSPFITNAWLPFTIFFLKSFSTMVENYSYLSLFKFLTGVSSIHNTITNKEWLLNVATVLAVALDLDSHSFNNMNHMELRKEITSMLNSIQKLILTGGTIYEYELVHQTLLSLYSIKTVVFTVPVGILSSSDTINLNNFTYCVNAMVSVFNTLVSSPFIVFLGEDFYSKQKEAWLFLVNGIMMFIQQPDMLLNFSKFISSFPGYSKLPDSVKNCCSQINSFTTFTGNTPSVSCSHITIDNIKYFKVELKFPKPILMTSRMMVLWGMLLLIATHRLSPVASFTDILNSYTLKLF